MMILALDIRLLFQMINWELAKLQWCHFKSVLLFLCYTLYLIIYFDVVLMKGSRETHIRDCNCNYWKILNKNWKCCWGKFLWEHNKLTKFFSPFRRVKNYQNKCFHLCSWKLFMFNPINNKLTIDNIFQVHQNVISRLFQTLT